MRIANFVKSRPIEDNRGCPPKIDKVNTLANTRLIANNAGLSWKCRQFHHFGEAVH
jgi:hypothetical protein